MEARCRFDDFVANEAVEMTGLERVLSTEQAHEVPALLDEIDDALRAGRAVAGFVGYEAAPGFDPALVVRERSGVAAALPLAWFGVYSSAAHVAPVLPAVAGVTRAWRSELDEAGYSEALAAIAREITEGWTYQVNYTVRLQTPFSDDPYLLYRQLAGAQRGAHHGYIETDSFAIACGSPELFFSLADGVISTRPMKGTAPRGRWPAEDRARAEALAGSEKDRAENIMIVDLIRNDLGRIARYGSVEVTSLFDVERYPTLWQLTSTVRAHLGADVGLARIFEAIFPCGSVTGAPKASTMDIIARLERSARGVYCGALGYAMPSPTGRRAQFAVPIRTAVIDRRRGVASYGVGSGVIADSTAASEWAELATKSRVLEHSGEEFDLFETLRYEPTTGCVNLARHLARLGASARYFGFSFAELDVERATLAATEGRTSLGRVRIRLQPSGVVVVDVDDLDPLARGPIRLEIDAEPVDRNDSMLFHKTSERRRYDERARRHPDADDVVLQNREGEVTETTRANLLVRLGGRWWTPALDCGLLAGIERTRLLEIGEVAERVITTTDLFDAEAIETVSSLRGRRPALLGIRVG